MSDSNIKNSEDLKPCKLHGEERNMKWTCARCDSNFWQEEVKCFREILHRIKDVVESPAGSLDQIEKILKECDSV